MSDTIQPIKQQPTPCDFGPFAAGACGKIIDLTPPKSVITSIGITKLITENDTITIDLNDYVTSALDINWASLSVTDPSEGSVTVFGSMVTFVPDKSKSNTRTLDLIYNVADTNATITSSTISITISDMSPELSTNNISFSLGDSGIKNLNIMDYITLVRDTFKSVTFTTPTEGTIEVIGSDVKFTPDSSITADRTVTAKFTVTTDSGLISTSNFTALVSNKSPSIVAKDINISLLDTATKTFNIESSLTIVNDTFQSVTFNTPSEGNIIVTGNSIKYVPNEDLKTDRIITAEYVATTTSGLTDSGTLTITINDDNIWAGSIWYGNSSLEVMDEVGVMALSDSSKQQDFPGTYTYTSGDGVYKWIVYPKSWGEPIRITDPVTGFEAAMEDPMYFTVEGVELIGFRTYYQLNGTYQLKLI